MTETVTPDPAAAPIDSPLPPSGVPPFSARILLRVFAWTSFVAETIIIGTGGAVRLTGSGLGCSEWPLCTPESLVPVYELEGIHGFIEFGNRLMTGVVGIIAIVLLLLTLSAVAGRRMLTRALRFALIGIATGLVCFEVASLAGAPGFPFFSAGLLLVVVVAAVDSVRRTPARRDLVALAWTVLVGVVAQAFVGGITVLTGLNPFIVGFHYAASLALVCVAAAYLVRMRQPSGARERVVPVWFAILTHVTGLALVLTIVFGVLTTGNGPHSGDADVIRTGFDATVLAHVHSWPGYALAALILAMVVAAFVRRLPMRRWTLALMIAVTVQVVIGVWQAREGLPPVLVGSHMVLAALSAAAYTVVVLKLKRPVTAPA